ncbi:hypothetical protein AbraIFM66950_011981 [Aspergillus brasiliensis]|nr:hypothetical protein AbraIFM66950_011981 [Aspergillus brasiliensis]
MSSNDYPESSDHEDYAELGPPQEVQNIQNLGFNGNPQEDGLVGVPGGPGYFGDNYHLDGSSVDLRGYQTLYKHNLNQDHVATPANINSASSLMMDAGEPPGLDEYPLSSPGVPDQHFWEPTASFQTYGQHASFNNYSDQQEASTSNIRTGTTFR